MSNERLFSISLLTILLMGMSGCTVPGSGTSASKQQFEGGLRRPFVLPEQQPPPQEIRSLQLHPEGKPGRPPVWTLGSSEQLVLSFDDLHSQNRQFRIEVNHRNQKWEQSPLSPSVYLEGFSYSFIQQSKQSFTKDPSYQHVEYTFPNDQLELKVSGNYLLEIHDHQGEQLLFSMPFFVTEDKGRLQTRIEALFAQRPDGRPLHQLFSSYRYPDFVEFPQFDLSLSYAQNQFWGRMRTADFLSTVEPGIITGHMDRDAAFVADDAFRLLDIREFEADGRRIVEYQPSSTPPSVILHRDVQNLDINPHFAPGEHAGHPLDERNSRYARVHFLLETNASVVPSDDIYVVGDFNNWTISNSDKMHFDTTEKLWKGEVLIKQGEYTYKYVLVTQNAIDDLALEQSFRPARQEYLSFVYFKDPGKKFDRLLKAEQVSYR